jgi:hypothetical protein
MGKMIALILSNNKVSIERNNDQSKVSSDHFVFLLTFYFNVNRILNDYIYFNRKKRNVL